MTKRRNKKMQKRKNLEALGLLAMLIVTFGLMIQLCINIFFMSNPVFINAQTRIVPNKEETANLEIKLQAENETQLESDIEITVEETTVNEEKIIESEINQDDLYWLSHLIMAEEEGACYENKLMCGLVAMNRVKDESFPNSLEEVIFQKDKKGNVQYACIEPVKGRKARIYLEPNEDSIKAAKEILSGNCSITIPSNVVYQAESQLGSGLYKKIENQYYSYK